MQDLQSRVREIVEDPEKVKDHFSNLITIIGNREKLEKFSRQLSLLQKLPRDEEANPDRIEKLLKNDELTLAFDEIQKILETPGTTSEKIRTLAEYLVCIKMNQPARFLETVHALFRFEIIFRKMESLGQIILLSAPSERSNSEQKSKGQTLIEMLELVVEILQFESSVQATLDEYRKHH